MNESRQLSSRTHTTRTRHNRFTRISDEAYCLLLTASRSQSKSMAELASTAIVHYFDSQDDYRSCLAKLHRLQRELDLASRYQKFYSILSALLLLALISSVAICLGLHLI